MDTRIPPQKKSHSFVCFHVDESRSKVPSNFAICDVHQGEDAGWILVGLMDEICFGNYHFSDSVLDFGCVGFFVNH